MALENQTLMENANPPAAGKAAPWLSIKPKSGALRRSMAFLFCAAGVCHFVWPHAYISIMPPSIPLPRTMVFLSGVFEVAGGIGLLLPAYRKAAAIGLVALLIAVFPANIYMFTREWQRDDFNYSIYGILLLLRLPLQAVLVWAVFRAAFPKRA